MKLIILVAIFICIYQETETTKKTTHVRYRYNHQYKYPYYKYPYNKYHYKRPKWPKIRGRCKISPRWDLNGTNPVTQEAAKGKVVVLFLMKRTCTFCYSQMESLNDLALYYK